MAKQVANPKHKMTQGLTQKYLIGLDEAHQLVTRYYPKEVPKEFLEAFYKTRNSSCEDRYDSSSYFFL